MTNAARAAEIEAARIRRGKTDSSKARAKRFPKRRTYRPQNKGSGDDGDDDPAVAREVFTIAEFCHAHHISEAFYYKLRNAGLGPVEVRALGKVTISLEAAAAWRRARESVNLPPP